VDADKKDPSNQSGRPWVVSGAVAVLVAALVIMLVIGIVVLG
jgi:hypothetical protein